LFRTVTAIKSQKSNAFFLSTSLEKLVVRAEIPGNLRGNFRLFAEITRCRLFKKSCCQLKPVRNPIKTLVLEMPAMISSSIPAAIRKLLLSQSVVAVEGGQRWQTRKLLCETCAATLCAQSQLLPLRAHPLHDLLPTTW